MMAQESTTRKNIRVLTKVHGSLLGAAVGDALGWAQELPKKHVNKKEKQSVPKLEFQQWDRRAGGQYYPHIETILAGEYSDDSQLLLCVARSLLHEQWWEHLARKELAAWLEYERGGGSATLKAARVWLTGKSPWSSEKIRQQYFDAGGNGVAMRILPHCIQGIFDDDFNNIRRNIFIDGIITHGHPRALIGALAYGFALWLALRETKSLPYGKLINKLLADFSTWSELPDINLFCSDWQKAANANFMGNYLIQWKAGVEEMLHLLEKARTGIEQGALAIDTELLREFGCFTKEKGSGTITATAAIFLASRYAADPSHGIIEAAFAYGSDTDTLASMTGGLLGAISGFEWLRHCANQVQDAQYFRKIGEQLLQYSPKYHSEFNTSTELEVLNSLSKKPTVHTLGNLEVGCQLKLKDTRESTIVEIYDNLSTSKSVRAKTWKLVSEDGQTLYFKKTWHSKDDPSPILSNPTRKTVQKRVQNQQAKPIEKLGIEKNSSQPSINMHVELLPVKSVDSAITLLVHDLEEAKFFYGEVLGLACSKVSRIYAKYGNILLTQANFSSTTHEEISLRRNHVLPGRADVYIQVESIREVYENVHKVNLEIVKSLSESAEKLSFTCCDPSANLVHISEVAF